MDTTETKWYKVAVLPEPNSSQKMARSPLQDLPTRTGWGMVFGWLASRFWANGRNSRGESSGCQCIVRVGNTRNPNERSRVIVRALLTTKYGLATDERFSWVSGWYLDVAGIVRRK